MVKPSPGEKTMQFKRKPIASAVSLALLGLPAFAQDAPRDKPAVQESVTVTGIRGSLEKSIETKRNADAITEVVTVVMR